MNFIREPNPSHITVLSDASHASEYDRHSRNGYLIFYGRNLLDYASRKSSLICKSSSAAELDALPMAEEIETLFVQRIRDISKRDVELKCYTDSKPVIDWMKQHYWKGERFLGIRLEHIKQQLQQKALDLRKIKGTENPANILTKPVPYSEFKLLLSIMQSGYNIEDARSEI